MKQILIKSELLLILFVYQYNYSQPMDYTPHVYGIVVSSPLTYDFKNDQFNQGVSLHGIYNFFLNGTIEDRTLFTSSSRVIGYFGIGFTHLLALQYGTEGSFRIRSDIVLFSKDSPGFSDWTKVGYPRTGLVVTIFYESYHGEDNLSSIIGFGVGIYF